MTRTHDNPGFGTLYSTAMALTSPVQGLLNGPNYGRVPQLTMRPHGHGWFPRAVDVVLSWHERARERRQLMELSDHMLRDIGVSRAQAFGEAEKPFWRA